MEVIEIHLTQPQLLKLAKNQSFQVNPKQFTEKHGKHHIGIVVKKHHHKRFLNNIKNNKGFRFTKEIIHGTGWWDDLKGGVSQAWNGAKEVGNYIRDNIPKDYVSNGLVGLSTAAGTLIGNPELGIMSKPFIDKGVDYLYSRKPAKQIIQEELEERLPQRYKDMYNRGRDIYNSGRDIYNRGKQYYDDYNDSYNNYDDYDDEEDDEDNYVPTPPRRQPPIGKRSIKPTIKPTIRRAVKSYIPQEYMQRYAKPQPIHNDGKAYTGRGLKKGSPEMKEKMAKLRAMRKTKGGNIPTRNDIPTAKEILNSKFKKQNIEQPELDSNGLPPADPDLTDEQKQRRIALLKNPNVSAGDLYLLQGHNPNGKSFTADWKNNPYFRVGGSLKRGRKKKIMGGWNPFSGDDWNDLGHQIVGGIENAGNTIANGTTNLINQIGDSLKGEANNVVSFYQQAASTSNDVVNKAIAEVAKNLPSGADAEAFGKQVASALIHQGIPQASAVILGSMCEALLPEGGPISYQIGSEAGKALGNMLADEVGNQTGYGIKLRHHRIQVKGGQLVHGVPLGIYSEKEKVRIRKKGLDHHHKGKNGLYAGGSFAPL